jgi:hypothetical protein
MVFSSTPSTACYEVGALDILFLIISASLCHLYEIFFKIATITICDNYVVLCMCDHYFTDYILHWIFTDGPQKMGKISQL